MAFCVSQLSWVDYRRSSNIGIRARHYIDYIEKDWAIADSAKLEESGNYAVIQKHLKSRRQQSQRYAY